MYLKGINQRSSQTGCIHTQHLFQSNEQSNISGASVLPSKRVLAYNIVSDLVIEDKNFACALFVCRALCTR